MDTVEDAHICLRCHITIIGLDNYIYHRRHEHCNKQALLSDGSKLSEHSSHFSDNGNSTSLVDNNELVSNNATENNVNETNVLDGIGKDSAARFFHSLELQSSLFTYQKEPTSKSPNTCQVLPNSKISKRNSRKKRSLKSKLTSINIGVTSIGKEATEAEELPNISATLVPPDQDGQKSPAPESLPDEYLSYDQAPSAYMTAGGKWPPGGDPLALAEPFAFFSDHQQQVDFHTSEQTTGYTVNKWRSPPGDIVNFAEDTAGSQRSSPPHGGKDVGATDLSRILTDPAYWLFDPPHNSQAVLTETVDNCHSTINKSDRINTSSITTTASRGKWMPGTNMKDMRKTGSTLEYFCKQCNRSLISRATYERHLLSEFHSKRTTASDSVQILDSRRQSKRLPKQIENRFLEDCDLPPIAKRCRSVREQKSTGHVPTLKVSRGSSTTVDLSAKEQPAVFEKCKVCCFHVRPHLMGKHLVSHFHCSRSQGHPLSQSVIINYIEQVVHQSPFQCALCRFYCTTTQDFIRHWESKEHECQDQMTIGFFWCFFCKHQAESSELMSVHITGREHQKAVAAVNKSMPIVIRKCLPFKCNLCPRVCRFNHEIKIHMQIDHNEPNYKPPSETKLKCSHCDDFSTISNLVLSRHILAKHKNEAVNDNPYFCSLCDASFNSKQDVLSHRTSMAHRYLVSRIKGQPLKRVCHFCGNTFNDLPILKKHLREDHCEYLPTCVNCGDIFPFGQELFQHMKNGKCTGSLPQVAKSNVILDEDGSFQCQVCDSFKSTSQSEVLLHSSLHHNPNKFEAKTGRIKCKYPCSICGKEYDQYHLRIHLRGHTGERPFHCKLCEKCFVSMSARRSHNCKEGPPHEKPQRCTDCSFTCISISNLKRHQKSVHNKDRQKNILCDICGSAFYDKYALAFHKKLHTGKSFHCKEDDCMFQCRTAAELRMHCRSVHSEERPFQCQQCSYAAKTKAQLKRHHTLVHTDTRPLQCVHCEFSAHLATHMKRHLRLHTGAKPYKCPHCNFSCNLIENLRKHVLKTGRHPGKYMYECRFCVSNDELFATNVAKMFRNHLLSKHADLFLNSSSVTSYLAGLYDDIADSKSYEKSVIRKSNSNNESSRTEIEMEIDSTIEVQEFEVETTIDKQHLNEKFDEIKVTSTTDEPQESIIQVQELIKIEDGQFKVDSTINEQGLIIVGSPSTINNQILIVTDFNSLQNIIINQ